VGGKTGTAEKAALHGYARHALISSFLAVFPASQPRYVVLVVFDEPKGTADTYGFATAGFTAAPTAARVIERIAPILRVSPVADGRTVLASN
jgi:cell division protein FtsI (penicillin-binding protein 3)